MYHISNQCVQLIFLIPKLGVIDTDIRKLQEADLAVVPDIHGKSGYSKIKCLGKNNRGQAETIVALKDVLNPKPSASFFASMFDKVYAGFRWVGAQEPVIMYRKRFKMRYF